jgi:reverse gyrase
MSGKCPVCDGKRTVTRQFRDYLCKDCLASGMDLTKNRYPYAQEIREPSEYRVSTAAQKIEAPKRGRPKKHAG